MGVQTNKLTHTYTHTHTTQQNGKATYLKGKIFENHIFDKELISKY